jgi:hypothetical protein
MVERRRYPRWARPLDGRWRGRSGEAICRIADISWGGCFIQSIAEPSPGEPTIVSVDVGGVWVEIPGRIVYVEKAMGFSVQFDALTAEQMEGLKPLLGEPPPAAP